MHNSEGHDLGRLKDLSRQNHHVLISISLDREDEDTVCRIG